MACRWSSSSPASSRRLSQPPTGSPPVGGSRPSPGNPRKEAHVEPRTLTSTIGTRQRGGFVATLVVLLLLATAVFPAHSLDAATNLQSPSSNLILPARGLNAAADQPYKVT